MHARTPPRCGITPCASNCCVDRLDRILPHCPRRRIPRVVRARQDPAQKRQLRRVRDAVRAERPAATPGALTMAFISTVAAASMAGYHSATTSDRKSSRSAERVQRHEMAGQRSVFRDDEGEGIAPLEPLRQRRSASLRRPALESPPDARDGTSPLPSYLVSKQPVSLGTSGDYLDRAIANNRYMQSAAIRSFHRAKNAVTSKCPPLIQIVVSCRRRVSATAPSQRTNRQPSAGRAVNETVWIPAIQQSLPGTQSPAFLHAVNRFAVTRIHQAPCPAYRYRQRTLRAGRKARAPSCPNP